LNADPLLRNELKKKIKNIFSGKIEKKNGFFQLLSSSGRFFYKIVFPVSVA